MVLLTEQMRACSLILENLQTCILGKQDQIKKLLVAVIAGGHVLLEDVPGTGKTQLVKALAYTIGGRFQRVQCNPDLLPTDITGFSIYHPKDEQFIFKSGPIMANLLLVDEINRASAKTQAALLEAMEEGNVTIDGETYALPNPFILLATQNPIEFEGTNSLPEAQLDRFMMKLTLGYPSETDEINMILAQPSAKVTQLQEVIHPNELLMIQEQAQQIYMDDAVAAYIMSIVKGTREHAASALGASPRASIALAKAARAKAFVEGRNYVSPDDVKYLAADILAHRLHLQMDARMKGVSAQLVIEQVLQETIVPIRLEH